MARLQEEGDNEDSETDESLSENESRRPRKKVKNNNSHHGSKLSNAPLELAPTEAKPKGKKQPIIVLLDQASLETVKNKKGLYEILNSDDHRDLCKKKLRKDPNGFRPDILHQELLALLDSPLNKAGLLRIYIATSKKVLIEVNPLTRAPRTYKRFAGLMVQLLHKMKIKANDSTTLLKVIKNPFSSHLPPGTRCFGFSCEGTLYSPVSLAQTIVPIEPDTTGKIPPICFVIGAMSSGHITINDHPYIEKMISISAYPLSGAAAISRLIGGIEHHWGIV